MFVKTKLKKNFSKNFIEKERWENMEKSEKLRQVTDKVLALFGEHEITEKDIEIIMENVSGAYKLLGILKKGRT